MDIMFLAVGVICLVGAYIIGLKTSGEPEKKPWKPKKKGFIESLGESHDIVHFPSNKYRR